MLIFGEIVDSGVPQSSRLSVISHVAFFDHPFLRLFMYCSTATIDCKSLSIDIISNYSQESKFCIKLLFF